LHGRLVRSLLAATKAWEKSIQALQEWMIKQRTLPELAEIIV